MKDFNIRKAIEGNPVCLGSGGVEFTLVDKLSLKQRYPLRFHSLNELANTRDMSLNLDGIDSQGRKWFMAPVMVKCEYWVNVYADGKRKFTGRTLYPSRKEAMAHSSQATCIRTVCLFEELVEV